MASMNAFKRIFFIFMVVAACGGSIRILASEKDDGQGPLFDYYISFLQKASIPEPLIQLYNMYKNALPTLYNDFSRWYFSLKHRLSPKKVLLDARFMQAAGQLISRYKIDIAQRSSISIKEAIDLFKLIVRAEPKKDFFEYKNTNELDPLLLTKTIEERIEYYLKRIIMKIEGHIVPDDIDLKRSLLQIIQEELLAEKSQDPDLRSAIESLIIKWNQQEMRSFFPEKKALEEKDKTIKLKDYIGVPEGIKEFIERIKHPDAEVYKVFNVPLPSGMLFTGAAGTGKTYLARAIAGELKCPFFEYSATAFVGEQYIGTAAKEINKAFATVREAAKQEDKKMAIMFIDEFDAIGSRETAHADTVNDVAERVNTFLTQLNESAQKDVKVIVIAATNYPLRIDGAITRSGRFTNFINIPYPNKENRKELLIFYLSKSFTTHKDIKEDPFLDKLADVTEGLSHADIELLINNASEIAIKQKKLNTGIDRDCLARALWNMKQTNYIKQLPERAKRAELFNRLLEVSGLRISLNDLLIKTDGMALVDIQDVFEKAHKRAQDQPENSLLEWLMIAIEAQKRLTKIKQNRELIHMCEKIYDPIEIKESYYPYKIANFSPEQRETLFNMQPEDIFKKFAESQQGHALRMAQEVGLPIEPSTSLPSKDIKPLSERFPGIKSEEISPGY